MSAHTCHALRCEKPCPSRMFMCLAHWRALPQSHRDAIWAAYRRGQEVDKRPWELYLVAARSAQVFIADSEGVPVPPRYRELAGRTT